MSEGKQLASNFLKYIHLITPYSQRFLSDDEFLIFNEKIESEGFNERLSYPAKSFAYIIQDTVGIDMIYDDQTLVKILNDLSDEEIKFPKNDREALIEHVYNVANIEMESGNFTAFSYGLNYLLKGILFDGNWINLSDNDFESFAKLYGVFDEHPKPLKLAQIISTQNSILRELSNYRHDYSIRGYDHILELIQPMFDPENIIHDDDSYEYLWENKIPKNLLWRNI